jgi:hypothetical protein
MLHHRAKTLPPWPVGAISDEFLISEAFVWQSSQVLILRSPKELQIRALRDVESNREHIDARPHYLINAIEGGRPPRHQIPEAHVTFARAGREY